MKKYEALKIRICFLNEDVITSSVTVLSGKDEQGLFDSDIF